MGPSSAEEPDGARARVVEVVLWRTFPEAPRMTRILVMRTDSLANVKANLSKIVDEVEGTHERVTITRNGRPAAVLVSPEDLDGLLETLEILSTPGEVEAIRTAEADVAAGRTVSLDDLRADLAARRPPAP